MNIEISYKEKPQNGGIPTVFEEHMPETKEVTPTSNARLDYTHLVPFNEEDTLLFLTG